MNAVFVIISENAEAFQENTLNIEFVSNNYAEVKAEMFDILMQAVEFNRIDSNGEYYSFRATHSINGREIIRNFHIRRSIKNMIAND